jgi:excisionase family DNA binding protein
MVALAFFVMSLFAVQIRLREKSIGFLEITGPPGSGKSTLVEFLWKLLGRSGYEGFDPNKATPAFLARSLIKVSNMPVGLIEGGRQDDKRGGHRQFDYNELLVLFNGRSPRGTGQKSNGVETNEPPFLGTIYLVQNERIDAIPAVLERLMSMAIDKGGRNEATREAAIRLEQWPMERLSGTIVHIVRNEAKWLQFYFERSEFHERDMRTRVEGLHNDRVIKNHRQLAAAVESLPHLFPAIRPEWVAETLHLIEALALDRQMSVGGDHPLVADFWEKVEYLVARESADAHGEGKSLNQHATRTPSSRSSCPSSRPAAAMPGWPRPTSTASRKSCAAARSASSSTARRSTTRSEPSWAAGSSNSPPRRSGSYDRARPCPGRRTPPRLARHRKPRTARRRRRLRRHPRHGRAHARSPAQAVPQMIAAGRMSAEDAAAQIAVFEALAAEWRWMETGEGAPADHALLPAITAALDASIATIAEIAMEDGGLSVELAAQAEWVIAMAWHLEPGRRTRAARAQTFLWRQLIAAEARGGEAPCGLGFTPSPAPAASAAPPQGPARPAFPSPLPCAAACSICAPPRGLLFPLTGDCRWPSPTAPNSPPLPSVSVSPGTCSTGSSQALPDARSKDACRGDAFLERNTPMRLIAFATGACSLCATPAPDVPCRPSRFPCSSAAIPNGSCAVPGPMGASPCSAHWRCQLDLGQDRNATIQTKTGIELAPTAQNGHIRRKAQSPTSAGRPTRLTQLLLTESEAAKRLAVSPRTLRKARQTGNLHYVAIGRSIRYTLSDLESFIAALRQVHPCPSRAPSRKRQAASRM